MCVVFFLFQAEDGIRDLVRSRGLGDVYKRQDLQDELLLHQSGRISDQTAVHFGKWIPATVALTIRNGAANQGIAILEFVDIQSCLLYTSDAADERSSVDLGGRRIIKKKK